MTNKEIKIVSELIKTKEKPKPVIRRYIRRMIGCTFVARLKESRKS